MKTENVLYTDGRDVTVTDSVLQVRKKWYSLSGITKHRFSIIPPVRLPSILLLVVGLLLTIAGATNLISISSSSFYGIPLNANELAICSGVFLLLLGVRLMVSMGERYAVSITTAEGERNVVVSRRKEYIAQIVHALNEAFFARVNSGAPAASTREFKVSGR